MTKIMIILHHKFYFICHVRCFNFHLILFYFKYFTIQPLSLKICPYPVPLHPAVAFSSSKRGYNFKIKLHVTGKLFQIAKKNQ